MKVINHHKKTGRQAEGKRQTGFIDGPAGLGKQSVFVKQDFTPVDDRILDNKGRITISNDWMPYKNQTIRSFKIYRNADGDLLLRPEVTIPAREAWIYENPEVIKSIRKGVKELEQGKGDIVEDLDAYLEKL